MVSSSTTSTADIDNSYVPDVEESETIPAAASGTMIRSTQPVDGAKPVRSSRVQAPKPKPEPEPDSEAESTDPRYANQNMIKWAKCILGAASVCFSLILSSSNL